MRIHHNTEKSLTELIDYCFSSFSNALNCIKIGEIVSFDKTKQTANIRILHKQKDDYYYINSKLIEYPLLQEVPCVIMGGGTSYVSHPISPGDQCVLLFSDYMIDYWQNTGEARQSDIDRRHDISDAIAIVGLKALPKAIQAYSDFLDLHYSDNSSIIVGDKITLNNALVEASGSMNVTGTLTAASVIPQDGYSGVIYTGAQVLTFANGILVSVE